MKYMKYVEKYTELGAPRWLVHLADVIFKGLPNEKAQMWPDKFISAIKPGADLEKIKAPFLIFLLESFLEAMVTLKYDEKKIPIVKTAIKNSSDVISNIVNALKKEDWKAVSDAWSIADSATSDARSAVRAAIWEASKTAEFAASVAKSAASAVRLVTLVASNDLAVALAASSAVSLNDFNNLYEKFSEKIIKLIEGL